MEWTFSGSIGIFEDSFFRGEGGENLTLFHISNIKNSSILMELSLYTIVKQPIYSKLKLKNSDIICYKLASLFFCNEEISSNSKVLQKWLKLKKKIFKSSERLDKF